MGYYADIPLQVRFNNILVSQWYIPGSGVDAGLNILSTADFIDLRRLATPTGLSMQIIDNYNQDVRYRLSWNPVTTTIYGLPASATHYEIWRGGRNGTMIGTSNTTDFDVPAILLQANTSNNQPRDPNWAIGSHGLTVVAVNNEPQDDGDPFAFQKSFHQARHLIANYAPAHR